MKFKKVIFLGRKLIIQKNIEFLYVTLVFIFLFDWNVS